MAGIVQTISPSAAAEYKSVQNATAISYNDSSNYFDNSELVLTFTGHDGRPIVVGVMQGAVSVSAPSYIAQANLRIRRNGAAIPGFGAAQEMFRDESSVRTSAAQQATRAPRIWFHDASPGVGTITYQLGYRGTSLVIPISGIVLFGKVWT
jgi:hypothetical protein